MFIFIVIRCILASAIDNLLYVKSPTGVESVLVHRSMLLERSMHLRPGYLNIFLVVLLCYDQCELYITLFPSIVDNKQSKKL